MRALLLLRLNPPFCRSVASIRSLHGLGIVIFALCTGASASPMGEEEPVFSIPVADTAREQEKLDRVLAISPAELSRWNPPLADFCHVGCPSCGEGRACGSDTMDWQAARPFEIRCRHCGEIFPSARFPDLRETRITGPDGAVQRYGFRPGPDGWPYYVESLILHRRRNWLRGTAQRLGAMYRATGDLRYAEQAKAILLSFARVYDRLPVHGSSGEDFRPAFFPVSLEMEPASGIREIRGPDCDQEAGECEPYPQWSVRLGTHWYYREIPEDLVLAYDQVKPVLTDPERREVERFIRGTVNFTRTFRFRQDNMAALLANREILAGRVIGEPEFVRTGLRRLNLLVDNRFFADGNWCEAAPGYFSLVYRSLGECAKTLGSGGGFAGDAGGAGGVEDAFEGPFAGWGRIRESLFAMRRPDGQLATVYDTWSTVTNPAYGKHAGFPAPRDVPATLLWASGHAVLTHEGGREPVQVRLQFSGKYRSHYHLDNLGLQLYALGREPYSDLGYTHTRMRPFARTTVSHNTVVVNDAPQALSRQSSMGGQVEVFEDGGVVKFVSVSSPESYPQTSTYRRSLALVEAGRAAYVVDLFEVSGGRLHEWFLHGDADHDEEATLLEWLPEVKGLAINDGKPFELWSTSYGDLDDPRADHRMARRALRQQSRHRLGERMATVEFASGARFGDGRMRATLLAPAGTELILGTMPSLRRAREVNAAVLDFETPLVVMRRQSLLGNLESRFVAVHQPLEDGAEPLSVSGDSAMLQVKIGEFTDYHFLEPGEKSGARFEGRYGFIRRDGADRTVATSLIDATLLTLHADEMTLPQAACGRVLEVRGNQIKLDRAVDLTHASRIYLTLPDGEGYALELAERAAGPADVVPVQESPGFLYQGRIGRFTCFPSKEIRGSIGFALRYAAHRSARDAPPSPEGQGATVATAF